MIAALPSDNEVAEAIKRMKPGMTPGATGITSDMLKALPVDAQSYIAYVIRQYWKGELYPK
jgi:hypothetical protein